MNERDIATEAKNKAHSDYVGDQLDNGERDVAEQRLKTAGIVLAMVEELPGDDTSGERIAEIAQGQRERAATTAESREEAEEAEEAAVIGDAEAMTMLGNKDAMHAAALDLGGSPQLEGVMRDFSTTDPSGVTVQRIAENIDRAEYEAHRPYPAVVSSAAVLLDKTNNTGKIRLAKLKNEMKNSEEILAAVDSAPKLSAAERASVSEATIDWLRMSTLQLGAPVEAGSVGVEQFDKTQRDRKFFKPGDTGGASRSESYAQQLFSAATNEEINKYVVNKLEGKAIVNLGGGNAKLAHELRQDYDAEVSILNVEPYPSERALNDPESDPICIANPANAEFMKDAGIAPHSVDEIMAVFSVPAYLSTGEEITDLFNNIHAMLKPGGHARIGAFGVVGDSESGGRRQAIYGALESMKARGYLIELVKTGNSTLILTAPDIEPATLDAAV